MMGQTRRRTRPDKTRPDQTRPDQTRPKEKEAEKDEKKEEDFIDLTLAAAGQKPAPRRSARTHRFKFFKDGETPVTIAVNGRQEVLYYGSSYLDERFQYTFRPGFIVDDSDRGRTRGEYEGWTEGNLGGRQKKSVIMKMKDDKGDPFLYLMDPRGMYHQFIYE